MNKFDANFWEDQNVYIEKKKRKEIQAEKNIKSKKELQKKLKDRDSTVKGIAKHYAEEASAGPSALEKRMLKFLDEYNVQYNFQRVFLIKNKSKHVERFYIADFYIPNKNLVIETDGAFHDKQIKEDFLRTKDIQVHYPNIKVVRWRWHDFDSQSKIDALISMIK